MQKIFVVEDDHVIREQLSKHLEMWNYEVYCCINFQYVLKDFEKFKPNLVLLDIKLPFYDGYYWCSEIRKTSDVPIVFLSSASDNMNQVMAMHLGADDFIAKPFSMELLIAKLQAILRRTYATSESHYIEHKGLSLNTDNYKISYEDKTQDLTKNEFRILLTLMQNKGKIISRDFLMQKLWNTDVFIDDNTLTVNMMRLRKKIESLGFKNYIITKKGSGYMV